MQEIDDIFEDETGDEENGLDLSSKDVEQLQLLEKELSQRAKGEEFNCICC